MFDIGWSELLLVAVVAIIVVGPKDLPRALRTVGQWAAKVRSVAREFQNSVDEMIRESELEELRREAQSLTNIDFDEAPPRRIEPPGEGEDRPPAKTDEEASTYASGGAIAPGHSLSEPGEAAAERPAGETRSGDGEEGRQPEQATGANG